MKKALLPAAIAVFLPLSAMADVTVYGKANVSLQNADEGGDSKIELVSNASRIGIKGDEVISDGLKVIYQFEYQTEMDDGIGGNGQTFGQRNIFIGLQGKAGTIMGGHFDTPLKAAQEKVDLFNDLEGDLANIFNGETRASNIVQYVTPGSFGPFTATVAYITKENDDVDDGISASLGYNTSNVYLGVAMDQDVQAEGIDIVRAIGRVNLGPVQLGAMFESTDIDGVDDSDGFLVSALWNLNDAWALKAQYGESDFKLAPTALDAESVSVGIDYKLSKNAVIYGYYTAIENEGITAVDGGGNSFIANLRDDDYLGIGLDLKF
ncbi:porin [Cellvibrio sp. ARAG 10.3]|uniref:porin n=1 Tax=Cellvibrio sp. ARAG 10.3 TaxID=3451358 RepID=UPI003F4515B9